MFDAEIGFSLAAAIPATTTSADCHGVLVAIPVSFVQLATGYQKR